MGMALYSKSIITVSLFTRVYGLGCVCVWIKCDSCMTEWKIFQSCGLGAFKQLENLCEKGGVSVLGEA